MSYIPYLIIDLNLGNKHINVYTKINLVLLICFSVMYNGVLSFGIG